MDDTASAKQLFRAYEGHLRRYWDLVSRTESLPDEIRGLEKRLQALKDLEGRLPDKIREADAVARKAQDRWRKQQTRERLGRRAGKAHSRLRRLRTELGDLNQT